MVAEILTAGLADIIHEQSNGSPLFVEEISRWIKRTYSIDEAGLKNVLQASDILQKLVLSSLENLPEGQRYESGRGLNPDAGSEAAPGTQPAVPRALQGGRL